MPYLFNRDNHLNWVCVQIILIGMSGAVGTLLQIRLMDVAKDAQILTAALNHMPLMLLMLWVHFWVL